MGNIVPSNLNLQGVGVRLAQLIEVDKIQDNFDDYIQVLRVLKSGKLNIMNE